MENKISSPILVTGASGFLGSHITKQLLEAGNKVRGAVHSLKNSEFLYNLVPQMKDNLELVEADLLSADKWDLVVRGCEYVVHTASPVPLTNISSKEADVLVMQPAIEGTKFILAACLRNNVKKVIITSDFMALWVGNEYRVVTEAHWAEEGHEDFYVLSKTRAEKSVWDFYAQHKEKIQITTICPGMLFGPVLSKKENSSSDLIKQIMLKKIPGVPEINIAVVDVRDAADAHIKALYNTSSNGKRYILAGKSVWIKDVVDILAAEFEKSGYTFNKKPLGRCAVKFASAFGGRAKKMLMYIGKKSRFDNKLSINELGIKYHPIEESIIEMTHSLIQVEALPPKIGKCLYKR